MSQNVACLAIVGVWKGAFMKIQFETECLALFRGKGMVSYARQRHFRCKQSPNSQFCTLFSQKKPISLSRAVAIYFTRKGVFFLRNLRTNTEHEQSSWKFTNHEKVKNTVPTPRQHWSSPRQDKKNIRFRFLLQKWQNPTTCPCICETCSVYLCHENGLCLVKRIPMPRIQSTVTGNGKVNNL